MAVPGLTLIDLVRDKTTEDQEWLPTSKIQAWLDYYDDDWRLAAADCLLYMARDDVYETYQRGGIVATKPLLKERARDLRNEALSVGGSVLTSVTMERGDYIQPPEEVVEYSIEHPAYEYGAGLLHTVKEKANGQTESPIT